MRVVVGPVSAASARAWLGYAREVLDDLDILAADDGEPIASPDVLAIFDQYLTDWEMSAGAETFLWSGEIAPEEAEYHLHAFQKIAGILEERAKRTGVTHAPPESDAFYAALLQGVLSALEGEGASHAEFARHLGEFWPGQDQA